MCYAWISPALYSRRVRARARMFPTRVVMAMLFYAIVMASIVVYRPHALFRDGGEVPIPFGAGRSSTHTVFDLGTVAGAVAVLSFAAFTLVDVVAPDQT